MARRPTIADLARAAGVGLSTVDRVLNGRDPVRRPTAERVLAAAERIGYHGTGLIRQRLGTGRPVRRLAFVLQQRSMSLYAPLGEALAEATRVSPSIRGHSRVEFLEDLTPGSVADRLVKVGSDADAVAVVAADHPRVSEAVAELQGRGVPVFALISNLSAPERAGYVGLDNWKVGRTAAWAIAGLCRRPGHIGIFVGSHRYRCQEVCEMGFRAYFREHAPEFRLLEPRMSLEDRRYAYENALDLLRREPELVGLYVAGGGVEGVMQALKDEAAFERVVTVGLDLTEATRSALIDGVLRLVLSHPLRSLAETVVEAMAQAIERGRQDPAPQLLLPFDIYTPENV
jgi:LacI family transcriptional regulator